MTILCLDRTHRNIFNFFLPKFVGAVGILSGVIVLYWPKFRLPDSPDFQLFDNDHPFEVYDTKFKNMFWFEKIYTASSID